MSSIDQGTIDHHSKANWSSYEIVQTQEETHTIEEGTESLTWFDIKRNYLTGNGANTFDSNRQSVGIPETGQEYTPVLLSMDGAVEEIQGELALVVFTVPNGYLERYVSVERLKAKGAAFQGARIRLISKQFGTQTITDIENVSSEVPPAWEFENKKLEEFFTAVQSK